LIGWLLKSVWYSFLPRKRAMGTMGYMKKLKEGENNF